jgi:flagellar hook-associated protein 2
MAGLSSQGLGSGLDIATLVSKLVAAEKAPRQTQITRAQTAAVTTISALGSLKGAMGAFNDALSALKTEEVFQTRSANASDPDIFTATAGTSALSGTYDVEVESLAGAHQIASNTFASGASQVVGTGTLTIGVGTKTFQVSIDDSNKTLAQIRDAINSATDNDDLVRATIVNAADGAHLMLTAQASGAVNAITVAQAGGNGGLSSLAYNPSLTTNYTQRREASDAVIYVAGFKHTSTTNTFKDVVDGVTITAIKADDDETHSLTISNDANGTTAKIKKFVDSYNALQSQMATLRNYEPTTKKAGPLLGDALLRGIETDVRAKLSGSVGGLTGTYQTLASIGVTTNKDGTLALDSDKLAKALSADFDGVGKLFGSSDGVAARLSTALTARLADTAELSQRSKALNAKTVALQKEQADLETRMAEVARRYNQQFNALDSMLSNLQNTSSFLTTQLASIANINSSK